MPGELCVVAVLSPTEVVINAGSRVGVRLGMLFEIYSLGQMIADPVSGENLEQVELIRGHARVVHVQEKIATLESSQYYKRGGPLSAYYYTLTDADLRPLHGVTVGDLVRPVKPS